MKATKQKGFSIVEVVIVLVVLALIGGLGYVFLSKQPQTATKEGADTSSGSAKVETADIQTDLDTVDVDKATDTSAIDEALQ